MPAAEQDRGGRGRAHMGARAGAVGDVDRVGEALERQRLGQEVVGVARGRRRDLGGHDEGAARSSCFQARAAAVVSVMQSPDGWAHSGRAAAR